MKESPKRRWYQISLRTLLLLVGLLCVAFACYTPLAKARQRRLAREKISQYSVLIYDYQSPRFDLARGVHWNKEVELPGPAWLRKLLGDDFFINVVGAQLSTREFMSNGGLKGYQAFSEMRYLRIGLRGMDRNTGWTADAELARLDGFPKLEALILEYEVTDASLKHLRGRTLLRQLSLLNASEVTDEGIGNLAGLSELRFLHLDCPRVSDAGMVHIGQLKNLRELWLSTKVSGEGLAHLQGLDRLEHFRTDALGRGEVYLQKLPSLKKLRGLPAKGEHFEAFRKARPDVAIGGVDKEYESQYSRDN